MQNLPQPSNKLWDPLTIAAHHALPPLLTYKGLCCPFRCLRLYLAKLLIKNSSFTFLSCPPFVPPYLLMLCPHILLSVPDPLHSIRKTFKDLLPPSLTQKWVL